MSDEDFEQLEKLIGKLSLALGSRSVCIVNGIVQDGYHIATYHNKTGDIVEKHTAMTIKHAVKKFNSLTPEDSLKQ